jgi:peptidoglycan/LPS O-acetylase OafA/YrhL
LKREEPIFEDYLAGGALANVPFWIYLLVLTFDTGGYAQSNVTFFFTVIPVGAMIAGGFVASYLVCKRSKRRFIRIGLLIGVTATLVNLLFGFAASTPSTFLAAAICFVVGGVLAAMLYQRKASVVATV